MNEIKDVIAYNISSLRKFNNMTQSDLAEKLNYSDNTISRWERGEIIPSVETLQKISEIFNVPVDSLLRDNVIYDVKQNVKSSNIKHIATMLLCVSLVWFMGIITFFYAETFFHTNLWTLFVWCVPASCLIVLLFTKKLNNLILTYIFITILIWTLIVSIYLQFLEYNMYLIFLVGIPAQLAVSVWTFVRPIQKPNKKEQNTSHFEKKRKVKTSKTKILDNELEENCIDIDVKLNTK